MLILMTLKMQIRTEMKVTMDVRSSKPRGRGAARTAQVLGTLRIVAQKEF